MKCVWERRHQSWRDRHMFSLLYREYGTFGVEVWLVWHSSASLIRHLLQGEKSAFVFPIKGHALLSFTAAILINNIGPGSAALIFLHSLYSLCRAAWEECTKKCSGEVMRADTDVRRHWSWNLAGHVTMTPPPTWPRRAKGRGGAQHRRQDFICSCVLMCVSFCAFRVVWVCTYISVCVCVLLQRPNPPPIQLRA